MAAPIPLLLVLEYTAAVAYLPRETYSGVGQNKIKNNNNWQIILCTLYTVKKRWFLYHGPTRDTLIVSFVLLNYECIFFLVFNINFRIQQMTSDFNAMNYLV